MNIEIKKHDGDHLVSVDGEYAGTLEVFREDDGSPCFCLDFKDGISHVVAKEVSKKVASEFERYEA